MPGSTERTHSTGQHLRLPLRTKVLLYFFVPALVILGAVALLLPRVNDGAALALAGERNHEIAALLAEQLSRELIAYVDVLDSVASRPEIYQFEPASQSLALRALVDRLRPFDAGVVVVDRDGRVTAADARLPRVVGADWSGYDFAARVLNDEGPAVISDIVALPSGQNVVAVALPVRVPGEGYRGFIAGLFSVDGAAPSGLRDAIAGLPVGSNRRLLILDSKRRAVYHDAPQPIGASLTSYPLPQDGSALRYRRPEDGEEALVASEAVPETGWQLALEEPWRGLAATYRAATGLLLGLLLLGLIGPLLVAAFGVDRVTRPLPALTAAVQAAARGDLGQRVEVRTGDELELLAEQFNEMSGRLAQSYAELEQRVAERTAELNALYEQAKETATLAERNRLARELHDSVTQTIFSAKLTADVLPRLAERDPALAAAKLTELRQLTGGALAEMRSLLVELRPAALTEGDLGELLTNLAGAAQARGRAPVSVDTPRGVRLPPDAQEVFYRVAQEALNNALKHAQASRISVRLEAEADHRAARLDVADDGVGFDPSAPRGGGHLGLSIMAERAASIGADLQVASAPGEGTRVCLSWRDGNTVTQ